jgi:hypothetical protein
VQVALESELERQYCPPLDKLLNDFTFFSCAITHADLYARLVSMASAGLWAFKGSRGACARECACASACEGHRAGGVEISMGCHSCMEKVAFNLSVPGLSAYVAHGFDKLYKSAADLRPCSQPAPWQPKFVPEEYYHRQPWELPHRIVADKVIPHLHYRVDKLDKDVRLSKWDNFHVCEPPEVCRCCRNPDCLFYSMNGGLTDH